MQPESVTNTRPGQFYLAGPMSGIPYFNYPKFIKITKELREAGFTIHSPVEMDTPKMQEAAMQNETGDLSKLQKDTDETWGDVLAKDVKLIADVVDGVICMDGWEKSRGARLEVFTAATCRKPVYVYAGNGTIRPMEKIEYYEGVVGGGYVRAAG